MFHTTDNHPPISLRASGQSEGVGGVMGGGGLALTTGQFQGLFVWEFIAHVLLISLLVGGLMAGKGAGVATS